MEEPNEAGRKGLVDLKSRFAGIAMIMALTILALALAIAGCSTGPVKQGADAPPPGSGVPAPGPGVPGPGPYYTIVEVGDERIVSPTSRPRDGHDVSAGRHTFRMTFGQDVDRASVEAAIHASLTESAGWFGAEISAPEPSFKWSRSSDRLVEMTIDLDTGPGSGFRAVRRYFISPDGANCKDGQKIATNAGLFLTVRAPVTVYAVPAWPDSSGPDQALPAGRAVMTLDPGRPVVAITGDGKALIALEDSDDTFIGSSGDAPPLFIPWLYRQGEQPAVLKVGYLSTTMMHTAGVACDLGFISDGWVWAADMREVSIGPVKTTDESSPFGMGTGTDFIFDGLAVSGDGGTVACLMREPGEVARDAGERARLDLIIGRPSILSSDSIGIARDQAPGVMHMPAMADFYGPPVGMALDHDGDTLIFNDLSKTVHPLVVMDVETKAKRVIAAPASLPGVTLDDSYYPIRGFTQDLTISADGSMAAGVVSGVPVVVDLKSGQMRGVKLPARARLDYRQRPFSSTMEFSSDGARLAMTILTGEAPEEEASVLVYDLATDTAADRGPGRLVGWSTDGSEIFVVRPGK